MNRRFASTGTAIIAFALAIWGQAAFSQSFSSGSTGADGAFAPTVNQNITVRPGGVYNYTTVNIPANVTVRYFKNTDNAPVVILATGDVTVAGAVVVSGFDGLLTTSDAPALGGAGGPGGFSGGMSGHTMPTASFVPAAGQGPGGGAPALGGASGQSGNYAAPTLFVGLTPLFGGSGGGGGFASGTTAVSGSGGGGAILIASSTRITVNGAIRANGANLVTTFFGCATFGGPGSGGAIRLVAPEIAGGGGTSVLNALGGTHNAACGQTAAGVGRIRLEASILSAFTGLTNPTASIANAPGPVSPAGNPALANVPTLTIASVGSLTAPATPAASFSAPDMALAGTPNPVPVVINATNTPVGAPTEIKVRLISRSPGTASNVTVPAADHTGSFASSSATANVTLPAGQVTVLQASAAMTLTGQFASLFPLIDGEPVERVLVAATQGQPSALSLVTRSGREVPFDGLALEDQLRVAQAWTAMKEAN